MILVLTVTAMLLATLLTLPAGAQMGEKGGEEEPNTPECSWYGPFEEPSWDPWWEYWCYWHGWGWEFVFWVYD